MGTYQSTLRRPHGLAPIFVDQLFRTYVESVVVGLETREQLSLLWHSIEQYTPDHLVDILLAAMGGRWWTRDEAIMAAARHLGFRRTGEKIRKAFKSAINAAIRRGLLERDGPDYIRRTR